MGFGGASPGLASKRTFLKDGAATVIPNPLGNAIMGIDLAGMRLHFRQWLFLAN